ncbi:MAG: type II toxin-antitoxin system RelE/ParE family toxin [Pseudomonadota bacterium]|nr:type II toxin-antitoxin system RelE/ParE family toxin [Pseudomonadota bacterium]
MIVSFQNKPLQRFFETGDIRKLSVSNIARLSRILRALDDADAPEHMNLPGLRFHSLKGDRKGRFAVDATGNWRVTFGWSTDGAIDVDLEDYH